MGQNDAFRKYAYLQKRVKIKKKLNKKPTNKPAHGSEYSDPSGSGLVTWL